MSHNSKKTVKAARAAIRWLAVLSLVLACVVTFVPLKTTLAITATTDRLEIVSLPEYPNHWYLEQVEYFSDFGGKPSLFTGSLEVSPKVRIIIERISQGPLFISLRAAGSPNDDIGTMFGTDESIIGHISPHSTFKISGILARSAVGQNILLPLSGDVIIGGAAERPTRSAVPTLRQGTVAVIGTSFLSSSLYKVSSQILDAGDIVTVRDNVGPALGFIVVDERPSLNATFHVLANEAVINRAPARGYVIGASLFDRVKNDSTMQAFWAAFLFFFGLKKIGE
jgi:hypothetical protein